LPLPNEITLVNERRKVLFEKYSPKTKIINLFLELWDSCVLRGIGGPGTTDFFLTKNETVLFEFNRMSKKIFIADHILLGIWFQLPNMNRGQVDKELINTAISYAIKYDLKIDVDFNYEVDRLGDKSKIDMWEFVKNHSTEVDREHLIMPAQHIDDYIDDIMNEWNGKF